MTLRQPLVIGLAGGTGSGKSTVAEALVAAAEVGSVAVLPQDVYYKRGADLDQSPGATINYDEPDAFDTELLVEHIDDLVLGRPVAVPVYDFEASDRSSASTPLAPAPVVIVEGILVLHDARLRSRMQLKVFVDAPPDERFIRRLERDVSSRGRTPQSVINQYRMTVKPMHDLHVEPTKQYADVIIPVGGSNRAGVHVLVSYVRAFLAGEA
ncbi:MAG TPA: uridine kinase [Trueperaceae bacterium]|nr:uridine kinase [Trueperaceae bacterium]